MYKNIVPRMLTILVSAMFCALFTRAAETKNTLDQDVQNLAGTASAQKRRSEEVLQKAGPNAVEALIRGLDSTNQNIRRNVTRMLRQLSYQFKSLPNTAVANAVGQRLRVESDHRTRDQMVKALREYPCPSAVRELQRAAISDPDWDIRVYAVHYAAQAATNPATERDFFKKATTDKNRAVSLAAYSELAELGDKSGRDLALRTIAHSTNWYEVTEAIRVIGAIGNPTDIPMLKSIIDSKNTEAEMRLRAIHEYWNIQLLQLPVTNQLDFLIKALDDPSWSIRDWAYIRLWRWPDPDTTERLKQYLSEKGHRGYSEAANALNLR